MKNLKGSLILLLTAFIWGTAFVAQADGMEYIGPITFNCVRNFVATLALLPVIGVMRIISPRKEKEDLKALIIGGVSCGVVLATASTLQQIGLQYTTSGKGGFITALYIIFVPLLAMLTKKRPKPTIWIAVALAIVGMYLLCINGEGGINKGDIFIFACSIVFALHIMVIDHFSPKVDGVKMSCIQFFVCGCICLIMVPFAEDPTLTGIKQSALPILYTGVMSSGVAYTLQIIGQKFTAPTLATLIMSLESVFAALAGWVLRGETMSLPQIIGSVLVFIGIIIAQFV